MFIGRAGPLLVLAVSLADDDMAELVVKPPPNSCLTLDDERYPIRVTEG